MGLREAVSHVFKNYGVFKGRARRSEYWMFFLFNVLLGIAVTILTTVFGGVGLVGIANERSSMAGGALGAAGIIWFLYSLYGLAVIIPSLALSCRRLHDIGRSGAYILIGLVPFVGWIFLLIWSLQDGDPNPNQYGPSPKAIAYAYAPPAPAPAPAAVAAPAVHVPVIDAPQPNRAPAPPAYEEEPAVDDEPGGWPDVEEDSGDGWAKYVEPPPPTAGPLKPVVRSLAGQHGNRKVSLGGEAAVLGRAPSCKIVYKDGTPGVSGRHCAIIWDPDKERFIVKDMGSTYGTFKADGTKLEPNKLYSMKPGESIYLGERSNMVRLEAE